MSPDELATLITQYRPQMVRWAQQVVGTYEDAEDVVQTVCLELAKRDQQLKVDTPSHFLWKVVRRHAGRAARTKRQYMERLRVMGTGDRFMELLAYQAVDNLAIREALLKLKPEVGVLLVLVHIHGYTVKAALRVIATTLHKRIPMQRARYWLQFRGTVGKVLRKALT